MKPVRYGVSTYSISSGELLKLGPEPPIDHFEERTAQTALRRRARWGIPVWEGYRQLSLFRRLRGLRLVSVLRRKEEQIMGRIREAQDLAFLEYMRGSSPFCYTEDE